jgi:hypothetical protein
MFRKKCCAKELSWYCSVSVEAMVVLVYAKNYNVYTHRITKEENKDVVEGVKTPKQASFEFRKSRDHQSKTIVPSLK